MLGSLFKYSRSVAETALRGVLADVQAESQGYIKQPTLSHLMIAIFVNAARLDEQFGSPLKQTIRELLRDDEA